jgi:hypothetical protein
MNAWSDSAVTLATRLSDHLGPVTTLIDNMANRLLGKPVAQTCSGRYCGTFCTTPCGYYGLDAYVSYYGTYCNCPLYGCPC